MDLQRNKTMPEPIQYLINGYLRRCFQLLPSDNPYFYLNGYDIIIACILLFYGESLIDLFEINGKSSFIYMVYDHDSFFHVFGTMTIDRKRFNKYKWKIVTDKLFMGRLGIIDDTQIYTVKNGQEIWNTSRFDSAFAGSDGFGGKIFGSGNLSSFIQLEDVITIVLDYSQNKVTFKSQKGNMTESRALKSGIKSVRFIAEFAYRESSISFIL